jgi:hypothetical protein
MPFFRRKLSLSAPVELIKPLVHIVNDRLQKNPIRGAANANAIAGESKIPRKSNRLAPSILKESSCLRLCHIPLSVGIHQ